VATCTGIQNIAASGAIGVYPNPNTGLFTVAVNANVENAQVIILNSLGHTVLIQALGQGENAINAVSLARGVYQYIIMANNYPANNGKLVIE
jgi:hypothetical protein